MLTSALAGMRCICVRVHGEVQDGLPSGRLSIELTLPDLHAAHLDLGVRVHHQAGAVRDDRHGDGLGEAAAEEADGTATIPSDHDNRGQPGQRADVVSLPSMLPIPTG